MHLSFGHGGQFAFHHLPAEGRDAVGKHVAVQVVKFVLHHAGQEAVHPLIVLNEVFVHILHMNALGAAHGFVNAGQTQATFVHHVGLVAGFQDVRIDVNAVEVLVFGTVFREGIERNHGHADGFADLRSCQSHTFGAVHGFEHVGQEFLQSGIVGGDVLGFFSEHGLAVCIDGKNHGCVVFM